MEHGGNDLQITHIDSQNLSENAPHFALDVSVSLAVCMRGKFILSAQNKDLGA